MIWYQTDVRLVPNRSENGNTIWFGFDLIRFRKEFSVCSEYSWTDKNLHSKKLLGFIYPTQWASHQWPVFCTLICPLCKCSPPLLPPLPPSPLPPSTPPPSPTELIQRSNWSAGSTSGVDVRLIRIINTHRNIFGSLLYQTEIRLYLQLLFVFQLLIYRSPNQSENGKYNLISVWFNKIPKMFLSVYPG